MPIPEPKEDEEKDEFISRCMRFLIEEGRTREQAAGICYTQWKEKG